MSMCKFRARLRCRLFLEGVCKLLLTSSSFFKYSCDLSCLWSLTFLKSASIEVPFKLLLIEADVTWWLQWFTGWMGVLTSLCFRSDVLQHRRLLFSVYEIVRVRFTFRLKSFILVWKIRRVKVLVAHSVIRSLWANFGDSYFAWCEVDCGVWHGGVSRLDLVWDLWRHYWHVR